jgi:hypothetical protein
MKIIKLLPLVLLLTIIYFTPASAQQDVAAKQEDSGRNSAPAGVGNLGKKVLPNYRAYALQVDKATFKMVSPKDNIDVLLAMDVKSANANRQERLAATILQDIMVLDKYDISGLTYLVFSLSPVEAQYLAVSDLHNLKILLRRTGDAKLFPIQISFSGGEK